MGYVVTVQNQKGGAHKTTVITNLAYEAARQGNKVLLIDTDITQRSASLWVSNGEVKTNIELICMDEGIDKAIKALKPQYDFLFIDGVPRTGKLTAQAIKSADLVIIPVQPSPYDLWGSERMVELVRERQELTNGQPLACFLRSGCKIGGVMTGETIKVLEEMEIPMLKSFLGHRQDFVTSALGEGVSGADPDKSKASFEIRQAFKEIMQLLTEKVAS